jgi:predicted nucleic acid-binding protein
LPIVTCLDTAKYGLMDTVHIARRFRLSAYDAAYLELSLRLGLPLATLDASLIKAAEAAGVALFSPK